MDQISYNRICIIGLGLIGASIAQALLRVEGVSVIGVDPDDATRETALSRGWVEDSLDPVDPRLESAVLSCDLIVIATPAEAAGSYFTLLSTWGYGGIITDTASTKARICADAHAQLEHPERFIPGHPMAGSEVNGIEGSRADLFEGAHWILCPNEDTPPEAYTALHELLANLGARLITLPREDHDRAMAIVSHVPHIIAASLVELASRHADSSQSLFRLAAGGFKDSTRIAAGSPTLWTGIAFDNKTALRDGLVEMRDIIEQFIDAIELGDRARLQDLLDQSARARRAIPAKWLPATENLLEVRVPMRDRQGVVAEVTTIASEVGCNIQSIEIDHITSSSAVLSMVLTDEGDVGKLSTRLLAAGFQVSLAPLTAKE